MQEMKMPQWARERPNAWTQIPEWVREKLFDERCDPFTKEGCDDKEAAFINSHVTKHCDGEGCSAQHIHALQDEAKRLAAKRMNLKPAMRPWVEQRVAILHEMAARLQRSGRRSSEL